MKIENKIAEAEGFVRDRAGNVGDTITKNEERI